MKVVIDNERFSRSLIRLTHEIIEKIDNINDVVLIGIKKKGYPIALEIQRFIKIFAGVDVVCEGIDISTYRDDYKKTINELGKLNVNVDDKIVILVDDVLFTGRSVRAAMDYIIDNGRPSKIKLAVFVEIELFTKFLSANWLDVLACSGMSSLIPVISCLISACAEVEEL